MSAWLRPAGGGFGAKQEVVTEGPLVGVSLSRPAEDGAARPGPPSDWTVGALRAALAPDGTVLIAWVQQFARLNAAKVARGTLSGGFGRSEAISSPCRPASDAQIVTLDDGSLAVAWTDATTADAASVRLHLALPGSASASAPTARIRARVVGRRALRPRDHLHLLVVCTGGPCDVLAGVGDRETASTVPDDATRTVSVVPFGSAREPWPHPRRTTIDLTTCAATGAITQRTRLKPTLRRLAPWPAALIVHAAARRQGDDVVVTWRTDRPARQTGFIATAGTDAASGIVLGQRRTRFHVTLRYVPQTVRRVRILGISLDSGIRRNAAAPIR